MKGGGEEEAPVLHVLYELPEEDKEESKVNGKDRVNLAKELGITPGKLNLIQKLQDAAKGYDDIEIEDWLDKSVQEIQEAIKSYKKMGK